MSRIFGWDIGGAHLKLAVVEQGRVVAARQIACALWRGIGELRTAGAAALDGIEPADRHAVTMTGELADLFPDRASGVAAILDEMATLVQPTTIFVYVITGEFLPLAAARREPERVASANWHATACLAARALADGVLVDVGSTTTDIVPFRGGRVAARCVTDAERLATGELVYTGIARTPLAAITREIPFIGRRVGVMAEFFATAADAHRLAGSLPEGADLHPAADGRGKNAEQSRARLARMIGMDAAAANEESWRLLAEAFIRCQIRQIEKGVELVLSGMPVAPDAVLVGAGSGRNLAAEIARRLGHPYFAFETLVPLATPELGPAAADIAPSVAIALLLSGEA